MNAFLENPDQYKLLVDDPDGQHRGATEEILRWASPVMYFRRNATKDFELRGETIKAGDKISLWYISANRDEDVWDDPFTFDITRDPNPHIAFGGGGPHFCLGAQLARMEIHVLFEELARRVPDVEQLGAPDRCARTSSAASSTCPCASTRSSRSAPYCLGHDRPAGGSSLPGHGHMALFTSASR